jgi:uncharacterized protein
MRLELEKLPSGTSWRYDFAPHELDFGADGVRVLQPVEVAGTITHQASVAQVTGRIETVLEIGCDRCLNPFTNALAFSFEAEFVTLETYAAGKKHDLGPDDFKLMVFDGLTIDLSEVVRGEILLALPSHNLCQESCRGLCGVCGANLNLEPCNCAAENLDPRWAALREFKR